MKRGFGATSNTIELNYLGSGCFFGLGLLLGSRSSSFGLGCSSSFCRRFGVGSSLGVGSGLGVSGSPGLGGGLGGLGSRRSLGSRRCGRGIGATVPRGSCAVNGHYVLDLGPAGPPRVFHADAGTSALEDLPLGGSPLEVEGDLISLPRVNVDHLVFEVLESVEVSPVERVGPSESRA